MKIIAASLSVATALAIGTVTALAGAYDPAAPILSATASGTQPNCAYTLTAYVANITPGDQAELGVILWVNGQAAIAGPNTSPVPVYPPSLARYDPAAIYQINGATPDTGRYELALYVGSAGGTQWSDNGDVMLNLPGGYAGTCTPVPTPAPTPTPTISQAPAVTHASTANKAPASNTHTTTQAPATTQAQAAPVTQATTAPNAPLVAQAVKPQARPATVAPATHAVAAVGAVLTRPVAGVIPTWALALFALGALIGAALMLNLLRSRSVTR